jgi:hypothetical protein
VAYRLKPEGSASDQLSRIVRRELERAAGEMDEAGRRPKAVRDVRKRIKKIRAIVHLLRAPLGRAYRTYNRQLRAVAHRLGVSRDADAAIETMRVIHTHYPRLVTKQIFEAVRRGLTPKERDAALRLQPAAARRELRDAAKRMPHDVRRAAHTRTIHAGAVRGYSLARKALRDLQTTPEDVRFHLWRRRVKDHWYHVRLFERLRPRVRSRIRLLRQLEHWLGDDHNLVLLRATLLESPSRFGDEHAMAVVLGCVETYQGMLRKRALALGARLFAPKPRVFGKSIRVHT